MIFTIYETSTGRVVQGGTSYDPYLFLKDGQSVVEGVEFYAGWMVGDKNFEPPTQPSFDHVFDWNIKQWIDPRTLQDLKDAQWAQIKQARSQAEYAGFTWDGSVFDSDAISQNRITGAVTLATLSPAFTISWILADNTVRTLSATDMMQVGEALGQHVAAQFAHGAALRAQIEEALARAEVEAVVW